MIEIHKYKEILNAIPTYVNAAIRTKQSAINTNLISFPFHLKCLNLSANNGSSATSKYEKRIG
jgi:hypothetical protein